MPMMNTVFYAVAVIVVAYLTVVAALALFQRALLYHPTEAAPPIPSVLADRGEALRLPGHDAVQLHTWWWPPLTETSPVIVYFHGNAGAQSEREKRAIGFAMRGYGILMPTYRYNAGAQGAPSEKALIADGQAVLDWVKAQGIDASRIVLFGESLGSGIATALAMGDGQVGGLILDSPFDSIPSVAQKRFWFAPVNWFILDRFESLDRIRQVSVPILIGHGGQDRLIPLAHAEKLFEAARAPKTFALKPQASHIQLFEHGFAADIDAFMASLTD